MSGKNLNLDNALRDFDFASGELALKPNISAARKAYRHTANYVGVLSEMKKVEGEVPKKVFEICRESLDEVYRMSLKVVGINNHILMGDFKDLRRSLYESSGHNKKT